MSHDETCTHGCSSHGHHHAEETHNHGGCGCCSSCGCGCQSHGCGSCGSHKHKSYADQLLALADDAWEEVLKEKIKQEILKGSGGKLDELAKLVSQTNHKRWKELMSEKSNEESFKDQLRKLLNEQ